MKPDLARRSRCWSIALALGLCVQAHACTIPVFRFALDRWEADPFRLVIPPSWATQPDMMKLLVPLRGNAEANIRIEESTDSALAEARLLFPHHDAVIWSGKLDATALPPLLDSPARRELLKRILSGESAVWVVCATEGDKAEADRVEKRLRYLEQVAALPPQDPDDPDSKLGPGPPLKLKFSVLRISFDDPGERHFAAMIAGPKHQDLIANKTSFAAPVFARGRVLGAWPVADLDDIAIEDASLFLIGRCSCRIKNENPGWDVVLKADWERELVMVAEAGADTIATSEADMSGGVTTSPTTISVDGKASGAETFVASPTPRMSSTVTITNIQKTKLNWLHVGAWVLGGFAVVAALMLWFKR